MTASVELAPKLDISAASELTRVLRARKENEVVLDFSEVKHLGALCLQVLLSAATSANAENRRISYVNISERVTDQLRVMGVTPETLARGRS